MLTAAPRRDVLSDLATSQRETILEFISLSSTAPGNAEDVLDILNTSLALKYLSVRRN